MFDWTVSSATNTGVAVTIALSENDGLQLLDIMGKIGREIHRPLLDFL